jgi:OmpA-OmpF porin, OOP family
MKKKFLLLITFFTLGLSTYAQDEPKKEVINADLPDDEKPEYAGEYYNRWSIEADFGQTKGTKPYSVGYYYSNPNIHINFDINHFGIAGRYMASPKFGVRLHLSYDKIHEQKSSGSLPFEMQNIQASFEGVVNTMRLFNVEKRAGRFGLLFHLGFHASQMTPMMNTTLHNNKGRHEFNGGIVGGLMPQLRILKNLSVFADFTFNSNVRQHFTWDGAYADGNNNLTGSMYTTSLGLSFSFGKQPIHGDWAIIDDEKSKGMKDLDGRIGAIEAQMSDTDKDGVPDYLDVENNSIAGVAVDTKGRMVDKNTNGVPDELEKYVDNSITNNNNNVAVSDGMLVKLINDGYIAAYFDTDKRQPTNASTDNIGFILNYLRTNPGKSIDIIGYADELGNNEYNSKLSTDRANNVRTILIKAGIDPSRLNMVGNGVDNSVDKTSEYARRLVRKVVFKIKG